MEKKIELKFNKTLSNLTGNTFGKATYEEQAKNEMNNEESVQIVFPSNIEVIGTSFIQGFFSELVKIMGFDGIEKRIKIKADGIEDAQNYVYRKLKF